MKIYRYPERSEWKEILQRPALDSRSLQKTVGKVLQAVKTRGDKAVKKYTREFDGVSLRKLEVTEKEIQAAHKLLPDELKAAIKQAAENIRRFHQEQLAPVEAIETMPGIKCWRKSVGIEKVGLYIPGGTAPLFSTILMLGIPAGLAGCREIVLCTPPSRDGLVHPAILFAASLVGVTRIFKVGGVQAIAAMAYGTASIPQVYKIFGPGNQYVTCAKQMIQQEGVAIDMPAGPSEVAVLADETANAAFVAADLLSQAEHGADSQVLLVSTSDVLLTSVLQKLNNQLEALPRKELAARSLANSKAVLLGETNAAIDLLNEYAAEHLIISHRDYKDLSERVVNAGSVFLGNHSPESVGDYASGTNHTLPTNGFARAYNGVSVDSFVKKITFQELTREGLNAIAPTVIQMAEAEGLQAHSNAVKIRVR